MSIQVLPGARDCRSDTAQRGRCTAAGRGITARINTDAPHRTPYRCQVTRHGVFRCGCFQRFLARGVHVRLGLGRRPRHRAELGRRDLERARHGKGNRAAPGARAAGAAPRGAQSGRVRAAGRRRGRERGAVPRLADRGDPAPHAGGRPLPTGVQPGWQVADRDRPRAQPGRCVRRRQHGAGQAVPAQLDAEPCGLRAGQQHGLRDLAGHQPAGGHRPPAPGGEPGRWRSARRRPG